MSDLVSRMKQAADTLGWEFVYGTNSVLNMIDAQAEDINAQVTYLLLLPVVRRPQIGRTGGVNSYLYDMRFMIVSQNAFDHMDDGEATDYYFQKYEHRVKPAMDGWRLLNKVFVCPGVVFTGVRIEEVINQFNSNLDGIFVQATATVNIDSQELPHIDPINISCTEDGKQKSVCQILAEIRGDIALQQEWIDNPISNEQGNIIELDADGKLFAEGGGAEAFSCNDLEECENFKEVRDTANSALSGLAPKANTADLGAVAFTNDYNDLDNLPPQQLPLTIASDLSENAFTDTGTDIIMSTLFIPANTFDPTKLYKLIYEAGVYRDASGPAAGVLNIEFCINTSPSVGGIILPGNNEANTRRWNYMERTLVLRGGNVISINNPVGNDNGGVIQSPIITPVNWAVDQYIVMYVSQNQAGVRLSNIEASLILVAEETT